MLVLNYDAKIIRLFDVTKFGNKKMQSINYV